MAVVAPHRTIVFIRCVVIGSLVCSLVIVFDCRYGNREGKGKKKKDQESKRWGQKESRRKGTAKK